MLDKKCSEECVSVKLSDGTCDKECNTLACLWDGDDCDGIAPEGSQEQGFSKLESVNRRILYEMSVRCFVRGSQIRINAVHFISQLILSMFYLKEL